MYLRNPNELMQAAGALAAAARLFYLNLARQFPALLTFLVFLAALDAGFAVEDGRSTVYFWSYIALEPVLSVLSILAVRELLALTLSDYAGIRSVARWTMYCAIGVSFVISLLVTEIFWSRGAAGRANSQYIFDVELTKRSVVFSLAAVLVVVLFFLSRYPLHLPRNILVSSLCFSAYFLSEATRLALDSLTKITNRTVDLAQGGFIAVCLFGLAILLRKDGPKPIPQIHYSSPREEHLLQQLNALNDMMARAARR